MLKKSSHYAQALFLGMIIAFGVIVFLRLICVSAAQQATALHHAPSQAVAEMRLVQSTIIIHGKRRIDLKWYDRDGVLVQQVIPGVTRPPSY